MKENRNISLSLDNMLTSLILINEDMRVIYSNAATEQIFGLSLKKIINHNLKDIFEYTNLNFSRLEKCNLKALCYTEYEVTFVIDANPIVVDVSVSPFIDNVDYMFYILLEIRKVESQRRMNQEIHQLQLQNAARELVRGLAHEIKNPLGGLRGAAQLLERQYKDLDGISDYTSVIIEQADRLKHLVDRMLGPQKATIHEKINIHIILEKVRKLVQMDLPENIVIKRDFDPSIPEVMLDPEQMQQAILNIVCNAILVLKEKQISYGIITLKTRTVFRVSIHGVIKKMALLIQVIDNGPGIPQEIKDTIFYPMVTGRKGGIGLGLAISQNIVDQHFGKIECVSWEGHTEFSIYLPLN